MKNFLSILLTLAFSITAFAAGEKNENADKKQMTNKVEAVQKSELPLPNDNTNKNKVIPLDKVKPQENTKEDGIEEQNNDVD